MVTQYDVDPLKLNEALAKQLGALEQITAPDWAIFVRTGGDKVRPPSQNDWWQRRAASVLLNVSRHGPIGVNKLRVRYGGKQRRGYQPSRFKKASGNILRTILQQLESAKLVEQKDIQGNKGRVTTAAADKLIASAAKEAQ